MIMKNGTTPVFSTKRAFVELQWISLGCDTFEEQIVGSCSVLAGRDADGACHLPMICTKLAQKGIQVNLLPAFEFLPIYGFWVKLFIIEQLCCNENRQIFPLRTFWHMYLLISQATNTLYQMFTTVLFVPLYTSHFAADDTFAPFTPTTHAGSSKLVLSSHGLWLKCWTVSEAQTSAGILSLQVVHSMMIKNTLLHSRTIQNHKFRTFIRIWNKNILPQVK
jgi:hypothetical protein